MERTPVPRRAGDGSSGASPAEESRVAEKYAHKLIRTLRVRLVDRPGMLGVLATAVGGQGALIGDVRKLAIDSHSVLREVTIYVDDPEHLARILQAIGRLEGITVEAVIDEVLQVHEGGKLEVRPRAAVTTLLDLQKIYTPGVADVCRTIVADPSAFRRYTWAGRTVAIVTDGSAVLGLGDLGPAPALPVMEGKAVILGALVGVGCVPLILSERAPDRVVDTVAALAGGFGAIMLEDIAAPRCFEIEARLRARLPVPVFHDDQHGTAVVVLAALEGACRATGTALARHRAVISGAGAAGAAIARLLVAAGVRDVVVCDRAGALYAGRTARMDPFKEELARLTNPRGARGTLADVLAGAHVFVGVSSPGLVTRAMVASMAEPRIVLALANPDPEIAPAEALAAGARVAVDGRTANNALAFPGIIRGALDAGASAITEEMKVAAARAIVDAAPAGLLLPPVLDRDVHRAVTDAVAAAWRRTGASGQGHARA